MSKKTGSYKYKLVVEFESELPLELIDKDDIDFPNSLLNFYTSDADSFNYHIHGTENIKSEDI